MTALTASLNCQVLRSGLADESQSDQLEELCECCGVDDLLSLFCWQEIKAQAELEGPLWANFALQYSTSIICIAAVGHLGQAELPAASMSVSLYGILANRTIVLTLTGALETQASQARASCSLLWPVPPPPPPPLFPPFSPPSHLVASSASLTLTVAHFLGSAQCSFLLF